MKLGWERVSGRGALLVVLLCALALVYEAYWASTRMCGARTLSERCAPRLELRATGPRLAAELARLPAAGP